jgi:hypothetical protein
MGYLWCCFVVAREPLDTSLAYSPNVGEGAFSEVATEWCLASVEGW